MRLDNWLIVPHRDKASLFHGMPCIHGRIYGSLKFQDGAEITTSPISARDGEAVVTATGSVYELGSPNPTFNENGQSKATILTLLPEIKRSVYPQAGYQDRKTGQGDLES